MDNKTGVTDRRKEAPMEHTINFNEMNLYVRYVQYIEGDVNYYLPWRILYDNFLFFVDSGSITLSFEDQDIEFRENELCIIPPFLKNRLKITPRQHCWYYGVHFDFFYDDSESFNEDVYIPENLGLVKADLIEMPVDKKLAGRTVYSLNGISFPTKILIHDHARLRELFARLLARFQSQCFGHEILVKSLFYELIYMVIQEVHNPPESNGLDGAEVVNRYLQSLMNSQEERMDMAQIALEYGMPPQKFRAIFKSVMSRTPKAYAIECRIQKGKELLQTGRYNVSEVAYMLGYDDVFYFSKLFKRKVGISPKKYADTCIK